jgi:hypothetical protein
MSKGRSGGLNDIEQWISTVEAPRLVIVDTPRDSQVGARICNGLGIMRACLETQKL